MAWTTPMTFVDGQPLTASQLNTHLRDNLNETEVALATTAGGIFISDGLNKIVERSGGAVVIPDQEKTDSTTYTDLETKGPVVTCNTGTRAFYFVTCSVAAEEANNSTLVGLKVSGSTTIATFDVLQMDGITEGKANTIGTVGFFDNLVPGENIFTLQYRMPSGTLGVFGNRNLTIIPF